MHAYDLHHVLLGALGADDVVLVRDEALAYETGAAGGAVETVVVPVAVLEGDELGAADAGDGLAAGEAPLRKQLAEAVGAIGLVVAAGEPGAC